MYDAPFRSNNPEPADDADVQLGTGICFWGVSFPERLSVACLCLAAGAAEALRPAD